MPVDLAMLLATAVLYGVMDFVPQLQKIRVAGASKLMGNRHDMPELSGWALRAKWAHDNLGRSLPIFSAVVIVGHLIGATGGALAVGATIYFLAYVAHQACYVAGIGPARSLAWGIAKAGLLIALIGVIAGA